MILTRVSNTSSGRQAAEADNWTVSEASAYAMALAHRRPARRRTPRFGRPVGGWHDSQPVAGRGPSATDAHTVTKLSARPFDVPTQVDEESDAELIQRQFEEAWAALSPEMREALGRFVGVISTPFPVDQDTYFEGKKGLDGVPD